MDTNADLNRAQVLYPQLISIVEDCVKRAGSKLLAVDLEPGTTNLQVLILHPARGRAGLEDRTAEISFPTDFFSCMSLQDAAYKEMWMDIVQDDIASTLVWQKVVHGSAHRTRIWRFLRGKASKLSSLFASPNA